MVGLGETRDELVEVFRDLRRVDCQILTVGQYLRPSLAHLPMERYYTPDEFLSSRTSPSIWALATSSPAPSCVPHTTRTNRRRATTGPRPSPLVRGSEGPGVRRSKVRRSEGPKSVFEPSDLNLRTLGPSDLRTWKVSNRQMPRPPDEFVQVRALTAAFFARFFESDTTAERTDATRSFFWLLAILAAPGLLLTTYRQFLWERIARRGEGIAALHQAVRSTRPSISP